MATYKIHGPRTVRHEMGELDMVGEFCAVSSEGREEEVPEWAFCWDLPNAKAALAAEVERLSVVQEAVLVGYVNSDEPVLCQHCDNDLCHGTGIYEGRKCDGIPF